MCLGVYWALCVQRMFKSWSNELLVCTGSFCVIIGCYPVLKLILLSRFVYSKAVSVFGIHVSRIVLISFFFYVCCSGHFTC